MNILAYVQLRNIYGSTGHGRVARQITEQLALGLDDQVHILADPLDHQQTVHRVGAPWTEFLYHFIEKGTSRQQAHWATVGRPKAEHYWPEAQIVYCTNESYVPTRRARLVSILHDAALFEKSVLPQNWTFFKQRQKTKWLFRILSKKADLVHTVSHFSAERIAHFFPDLRSRLRVIHNGVSPCFFMPISGEGKNFLRELGFAERPFILLPGGLNHRKNAELVLEAWPSLHSLHPELTLVVAGHCRPDYVSRAQGLECSVVLTGFIDDEYLCALYRAAQIVWFPSLYEGFGMPVLEAMACGAPVVTSNSTSLPEIAGDAAVLISPKSVDEHVQAIDALLRDSVQRETLSQRGKLHSREFSWQRTASQLRQHFLSLV